MAVKLLNQKKVLIIAEACDNHFGSLETANKLMEKMQDKNLGYLAVSLGFHKTLFCAPGTSTSSEISEEEQEKMGLSEGLIRFSVGLDQDISRTYEGIKKCLKEFNLI